MDDDKRTVVVAALSAYAGLLAARVSEPVLEQSKGKGKAFQDDVNLTAEIQNHLELCGELTSSIADASSIKDIARTFEPAGIGSQHSTNERVNSKRNFEEIPGASNSQLEKDWWDDYFQDPYHSLAAASKPEYSSIFDEQPYHNPFTGLLVIPETGFEAGPSSRPPPLQKPPRMPPIGQAVPQRTLSMPAESKQESPMPSPQVPLKPSAKTTTRPKRSLHLQSRFMAPPRPTATPEFRLRRTFTEPLTTPGYGLTHMSSIREKPTTTGPRADILFSKPSDPPGDISSVSPNDQPPIPLHELEANIQVDRDEVPEDGIHGSNLTHKHRYLRHIAGLTSKALKSAGSMLSISRTRSVHQPQALGPQEAINTLAEPPDCASIARRNTISPMVTVPRKEDPQRTASEPNPPPAYTSQHVTRRPPLSSVSSVARGGTRTPSAVSSSRTNISSPSDRAVTPSVALPINGRIQRRSRLSYHQFLPITTVGIEESSTRVASKAPLSNEAANFSFPLPFASPRVRSKKNGPRRRNTVSSTFKPAAIFDSSIKKRQSRISSPASPSISPGLEQRTDKAQKRQPASSPPQNHRNSNNPWKDHMISDIALARSLQQEEYQTLQTERELLLADDIANGTAEDEDIELAYYMSLETAELIALTEAATADPHTPMTSGQASFHPRDIDREIRLQRDLLEACKLDIGLRAEDASVEASLAAAKRLQAELDKESHDENALWEEWKKGNIEECIACGDEQLRNELARPCEHGYCDGCLQEGFEAAKASKTPFKCCQKVLDIKDCLGLEPEFVAEYEEMLLELSTPNPLYCCNAKCAKFLPPRAVVGDVGTCKSCKKQTCRHCKQKAHPGTLCQEDKETEAVKDLGRAKGWKTCPGCNHLIERQSGCLHMVCSRCHTAFCYRCSKRWKDCESTCPDPISALHPKT